MSDITLTNDEKLILGMILDEAETKTLKERENYLRSGDMATQLDHINALTRTLQFINKLQLYCMQLEQAV